MKIQTVLFVVHMCCAFVFGDVCEDVNSQACLDIERIKPDMCDYSCISNLCKRHCGLCPLKCYSCNEVSDTQTCTTTEVCPTRDHSCTAVRSFSNDFKPAYKLGCAHNSACQPQFGVSCCTQDLCNHNFSSTPITFDEPSPVVRRQAPRVCADLDDMTCNLLQSSNSSICEETCVAYTLCPRLCGKCYECYDCDHVAKTENCNNSRICDPDHVCYTMETVNFNLEHGFRVGCIHHEVCERLASIASSIFGRRNSPVEVSLNGGCCHGDLCNLHKLDPVRPTTTTTSTTTTITPQTTTTKAPTTTTLATTTTTQATTTTTTVTTTTTKSTATTANNPCSYNWLCPNGYVTSVGKCYMFVYQKMNWYDAKHYCEQNCGHLAVFTDEHELYNAVHDQVSSHIQHGPFLIGGYDPNQTNDWRWITNNQKIPTSIFYSPNTLQGEYCTAIYDTDNRIRRVHCSYKYYVMCQANQRH